MDLSYACSDADIQAWLPDARIISYNEINSANHIDEVFDGHPVVAMLYLESDHFGHWTVLINHGQTIEFFDSYGGIPDDTLNYISERAKRSLDEMFPKLSQLLVDSPYKLQFNNVQLQADDPKIQTCGQHCIVRSIYKKLPVDSYIKHIIRPLTKKGLTPDEVVVGFLNQFSEMI